MKECNVDGENGLNEVYAVFQQRKCLDCYADIMETPHWNENYAVVTCPECNQSFKAHKSDLHSIDTSNYR